MYALGHGRQADKIHSMVGAVVLMDFEAHDLPAAEVEVQVQIEPPAFHARGREHRIAAPDLARSGGDMRCRRVRAAGRLRAALSDFLNQCLMIFPAGHVSSSSWKNIWIFFHHEQGGRFGQRVVLAAELGFQLRDAALLVFCRPVVLGRFAETGDDVLLPDVQ